MMERTSFETLEIIWEEATAKELTPENDFSC